MDLAGISLTETDGQVFLRNQPVAGREPVDARQLHALLEQGGYAGCQYHDEALDQAANQCNTLATPFVVQVATRHDANVVVHLAADDMAAHVSVVPPQGGAAVTREALLQALADAAVVFGIDHAAVAQVVAQGAADHVKVARGAAAQNGRDAVFEVLLPKATDRAPKLDVNGLIDYREHGGIVVVKPEQPLMRRIPATAGVPGSTVRGRALTPRAGLDQAFAASLAGTQLALEDANLLRASVNGQPVVVDRGVMVEPLLHLKEVNVASGNVYFDGTVQIDGEVMQGMKVQATGDIVVGGTVDGGLLEAGGSVHVAGGIIAQAQVRAQGAVAARFAQNSRIFAGTVITLIDMALQCELEALNQIVIGDKQARRGGVLGGSATAMMLLRAPLIGSNQGGVTHVTVGTNAALEVELKALELRLEKEKLAEENLQKIVKQLGANGDPKGLLERVKASWRQAVQVWSQSLAERTALEAELALASLATVDVGVGVAGPVDLVIAGKVAHLRTEIGEGVFSFAAETGMVHTNPAGRVVAIAFIERSA